LRSLGYIESVSQASDSKHANKTWDHLPEKLRLSLSAEMNISQLTAIKAAAAQQKLGGFTLLQGPPGTGKTKTVVGLLNVLHLMRFQQHYEATVRSFPLFVRVVHFPSFFSAFRFMKRPKRLKRL
jgi:hypothetical protein